MTNAFRITRTGGLPMVLAAFVLVLLEVNVAIALEVLGKERKIVNALISLPSPDRFRPDRDLHQPEAEEFFEVLERLLLVQDEVLELHGCPAPGLGRGADDLDLVLPTDCPAQ